MLPPSKEQAQVMATESRLDGWVPPFSGAAPGGPCAFEEQAQVIAAESRRVAPLLGAASGGPCASESDRLRLTELLNEAREGNLAASGEAIDAVYPKLRSIAGGCFAHERAGHTWQPTALINEVYVRVAGGASVAWRNRDHFFAVWAGQMRHALVDYGRRRRAARRGCGFRVTFDENRHLPPARRREVDLLEELLERLRDADSIAEQVVRLKFYAGLTDEEVAGKLGCSHSTVRRHWNFARAWLASRLAD